MATVQFGCFSLVNEYQRSAAAGGNLNTGTCKGFSSFRTFFQENEPTSAININIQVSIGQIRRIATSQILLKLVDVISVLLTNEVIVCQKCDFQLLRRHNKIPYFYQCLEVTVSDRFHQKMLKTNETSAAYCVITFMTLGSKVTFSGRTAFTSPSQRSRI